MGIISDLRVIVYLYKVFYDWDHILFYNVINTYTFSEMPGDEYIL